MLFAMPVHTFAGRRAKARVAKSISRSHYNMAGGGVDKREGNNA
jgi:hypothetical protein